MNISRDNYESWFLDFLDGKLDAVENGKLMAFLDFNPDLKEELEGMEMLLLEAEEVKYIKKEGLKKSHESVGDDIVANEFEALCIASIEKQLSIEEENILKAALLDDPERQKDYRLFQSTLIKPELEIFYAGKAGLKKRFIDIPRVKLSISGIAAAVVLLIAVSLFFRTGPEQDRVTENTGNSVRTEDRSTSEPEGTSVPASSFIPERNLPQAAAAESQDFRADNSITDLIEEDEFPEVVQPEKIWLSKVEPLTDGELQHPGMDQIPLLATTLKVSELDDYQSMREFALAQVFKRKWKKPEERKMSFWKLADNGIRRINDLSEDDYSLERQIDEQGKTRRFTFETPAFGISTPMGGTDQPR